VDDFPQVLSWQKATDKRPIKTCCFKTFTGGEFRVKYETEPWNYILLQKIFI
jgi:hypothetical protein